MTQEKHKSQPDADDVPTDWSRRAGVLAGFALLSLLFTWPLATAPFSHVIGHVKYEAVPPLNTWAMATVWRNLFTQPGALLQGSAFYPYDNSVAFSEHLLVPALMAGPVATATGNWTFAYNVSVFTALVLSGFFMFLLVSELGGSPLGAFLGGGLYAFNTWNINEVVRSQILSNEFFPLVLLTCLRYARESSWPRAFAVGGAALLQALSCMYWAVYLPFLLVPCLLALHGLRSRALLRLALTLGGAAILVIAFAWPYVSSGREFGFARPVPESLPLDRYFHVLPQNLMYGSILGHGLPNQNAAHFQGFLALILCIPGALTLRATKPRFAGALLFLSLFSLAASLGPEIWVAGRRLGAGLYGLLFEYVPLFQQIRYPERFAIFVNLTVAILAALGLSSVARRSRGLACVIAALALAEHLSTPQFLDEMPPRDPSRDVYIAARGLPEGTVLAEVPATRYWMERGDAILMFNSIEHGKRTVEGFTGYFPPLYSLVKWHLFNFPSEQSLKFLSDFGVTVIIDRTNQALPPSVSVLASFDDGSRLLRLPGAGAGSFMTESFRLRPEMEEIVRDGWDIRVLDRAVQTVVLRDGDLRTAWSTADAQKRDTFVRVRFEKPERLARIRLSLPLPAEFPTRFAVEGVVDEGPSPVLAFDNDWAYTSLARSLWKTPRTAFMDIDLEPSLVSGFRIRVLEDEEFRLPITLSEIRAYRAPVGLRLREIALDPKRPNGPQE